MRSVSVSGCSMWRRFAGRFGQLTLNARVWLVMVIVVGGLASLSAVSVVESRSEQMQALAGTLRKQVETATSILDDYRNRAQKGELSEADARKAALRDIVALRWDEGTGYVFGFDSNLVLVEHPLRGDMVGKSLHDEADAKGFHHYQAMLTSDLKDGSGLVRYTQIMPKTREEKDKISFSRWYKPWDIHLVSGAYFADIDAAFARHLLSGLSRAALIALLVVAIVWLSMRSIRRTIGGEPNDAVSMATRIAEGDLRQDGATYEDGSLLDALQRMRSQLATIVADVQRGAHVVSNAASELTMSNDNLSQRTQEQASSLEESAASMEEMTATVRQNAESATTADRISRDAREQAEHGGHIAAQAMEAMGDISDSSNKIMDIVNLIDELAFQTHLLALNASIEAAHAGDQGRGFAVVASEVRRLAHSSASASKDIKRLVNESSERVSVGRNLVSQSVTALGEIVIGVKKVTDIVAEVAAASHEQSTGVDQVNLAIAQIDEVTQQNAALVEEAAAVAKLMEGQAAALSEMVAQFKLDGDTLPVSARTDPVEHTEQEGHFLLAYS
jgi:methyl-accepting chemotaxis protein